MQVRKLSEVTLGEVSGAQATMYALGAAMVEEQRENLRNHQEVHGVRLYSQVTHNHRQEHDCNDGCEFWSPS